MPDPVRYPGAMSITLVTISDTHALHDSIDVPEGDVLIHAGDLTNHGSLEDVVRFSEWLATLPHRHKLVIAGNHDFCFERDPEAARGALEGCIYLEDETVTLEGVRFYGSPWQPWFYDWAFNLRRGPEIRERWDLIPDDTDVLITHGPPAGYGDRTARGERVGCEDLLDAIARVRPILHVCGHIHEGYGLTSDGQTTFINASSCNLAYRPVQPPIVFEL